MRRTAFTASLAAALLVPAPTLLAQGGVGAPTILTVDHYVPVASTAPSMEGEVAQIYLRERVTAGTALRSASLEGRVVLLVHGAAPPPRWRSTLRGPAGWPIWRPPGTTRSRWT